MGQTPGQILSPWEPEFPGEESMIDSKNQRDLEMGIENKRQVVDSKDSLSEVEKRVEKAIHEFQLKNFNFESSVSESFDSESNPDIQDKAKTGKQKLRQTSVDFLSLITDNLKSRFVHPEKRIKMSIVDIYKSDFKISTYDGDPVRGGKIHEILKNGSYNHKIFSSPDHFYESLKVELPHILLLHYQPLNIKFHEMLQKLRGYES